MEEDEEVKDFFVLAVKGLMHRRLRSYLTIIGVIIGVAAVVAFISISWGMDAAIREMFGKFGADKIIVLPGSMELGFYSALMGAELTDEDLKTLEKIPEIDTVIGMTSETMSVEFRGEKKALPVYGIPTDNSRKIFEDIQGYGLESGSYFSKSDKYKVIVGYYIAHSLFESEVRPGSNLIINGKKFRVIGVLEETGSRMDDTSIIIPQEAFEELTGEEGKYMTILAQVKKGEDVAKVAEKVKERLKREKKTEDLTVMTSQQMAERISSILGLIGLLLVSIASISLLVGSVGIMNTMYMSVMERTREIGAMKAIGASPRQILTIFLIEAGLIGLLGGIIGVIIGVSGAMTIEAIARSAGFSIFRAYLSPGLIFFALGFSTVIGLISGYLPARYAASLDPVEALRYE